MAASSRTGPDRRPDFEPILKDVSRHLFKFAVNHYVAKSAAAASASRRSSQTAMPSSAPRSSQSPSRDAPRAAAADPFDFDQFERIGRNLYSSVRSRMAAASASRSARAPKPRVRFVSPPAASFPEPTRRRVPRARDADRDRSSTYPSRSAAAPDFQRPSKYYYYDSTDTYGRNASAGAASSNSSSRRASRRADRERLRAAAAYAADDLRGVSGSLRGLVANHRPTHACDFYDTVAARERGIQGVLAGARTTLDRMARRSRGDEYYRSYSSGGSVPSYASRPGASGAYTGYYSSHTGYAPYYADSRRAGSGLNSEYYGAGPTWETDPGWRSSNDKGERRK